MSVGTCGVQNLNPSHFLYLHTCNFCFSFWVMYPSLIIVILVQLTSEIGVIGMLTDIVTFRTFN